MELRASLEAGQSWLRRSPTWRAEGNVISVPVRATLNMKQETPDIRPRQGGSRGVLRLAPGRRPAASEDLSGGGEGLYGDDERT